MPPLTSQDWTIIGSEGAAIGALAVFAGWLVKFIIGFLTGQNSELKAQLSQTNSLVATNVANILQVMTTQTIILQEWRARDEARRLLAGEHPPQTPYPHLAPEAPPHGEGGSGG